MADALSRDQIETSLADLDGWTTDGRKIERAYQVSHIAGCPFTGGGSDSPVLMLV